MTVQIIHADCRDALRSMPDCSIDAVVTDPPYELTQANRRTPPPVGTGPYGRHRVGVNGDNKPVGGFMGKEWDGTGIAHDSAFWAEVLRVLKPGGHVAAFNGSRTYHRMACAIEDAGFEIRDSLQWIYGTGFPKSHNLEGEWEGFGTALKPAFEPIVLARKPLSEKTVAANVLRWGTGALNIDGCRIGLSEGDDPRLGGNGSWGTAKMAKNVYEGGYAGERVSSSALGRWPANVVTDGSDEVVGMFPSAPGQLAPISTKPGTKTNNVYGKMNREGEASADRRYTEAGSTNFAVKPGQRREPVASAARFFYSAKASKQDRAGSKHPTVKPIALMAWLARLITPPGGTILDPFAGSGTTGAAARQEGFDCILVERETEYIADIRRRLAPPLPPPPPLHSLPPVPPL